MGQLSKLQQRFYVYYRYFISQATLSRILSVFVDAMVKKASHYIYMPKKEEILGVLEDFEQVSYLPTVIRAIDSTHIRIIAPSEGEYAYVNRKRYHSINIQAICNANLIFRDVVAKWPGSHHYSFILKASTLHDRFESGEFGNCWLLGDSGYPLNSLMESAIQFHF